MNKIVFGTLVMANFLWAIDVPIDEVEKRLFSEQISVNSKIVQLSSSKSLVMAQMGGKITKYLVKEGDSVKKGQAIAFVSFTSSLENSMQISLENSLQFTPLKAEIKALRKRLSIANKNYEMVKKLYNAGVESRQNLNRQEEEKVAIDSEIEVVKAKLSTLKIKKKPTKSSYTIYAGNSGKVEKILVASNAVVEASTPLLSIVKGEESFLVKSYIPLKYVNEVKIGLKGKMLYGGKHYAMHVTQILPKLDEQTQQMIVLSTLDMPVKNLFVNAYVDSKLSFGIGKRYLSVKKTALSFFNNEWVVFVPEHHKGSGEALSSPKEHEGLGHEKHNEHEGHGHEKHDEHEGLGHEKHDEHKGHGHEKHDEHEGHGHEKHDEHEGHGHGKHDEHEGHGHEKHDEHEGHGHEKHDEHEGLGHEKHDEHEGHGHGKHDEHEEEEVPYDIKVVKIIKQNEHYVAIEGLEEHEDYVSDKSYYIKSMLLKSSLGGHGH